MNTTEITKLLLLPSWGTKEIQRYAELSEDYICDTHAQKIKTMAMKNGGKIIYRSGRVSVDSVLSIFGKNREQEIRILNSLKKE